MEYEDLVALNQMRNYFANNFCTFYSRSTYRYITIVVNQQNFVKFNSCAVFSILNVVYKQLLAFFSFELLSVNFYDYVHFIIRLNGFLRQVNIGLPILLLRTQTD